MNKKLAWILVVVIVVIGLVYFSKKQPDSTENTQPIKVGVILPLTGSVAVSGEKLLQGVELAKAEFDPAKVTFIVEDDHTETLDGVTAAKKLLDVDKVDVLLGLYVPDEVVAVSPMAKEKGVTIFSASYCSDAFKDLENVFCGYPGAVDQLKTVLPEIKKQNVKTVALINTNDDFGINSRDGMVALSKDGGYSVVINELVPFESRDLKTQADKVIASKADAVFMASGDTSQAFTLMKILKERGYKGMRITFVDLNMQAVKDFGSSIEGTFAPGIAPNQFSTEFTSKYSVKYGKNPEDYVVALGYDITKAVVSMIQKSGFDSKDFVSQAKKFNYENPAIKGFGYQDDRSVTFALELWTLKNGQYIKAE
ncbi:MAG TPA: ABC transporter substrate-binding protein [Candidatus Paceibacterota bacterium]